MYVGVVSGEMLCCCYYGWIYVCDSGCCVDVFYFGCECLFNGVCVYLCCEVYGLIFVFLGDVMLVEVWLFFVFELVDD